MMTLNATQAILQVAKFMPKSKQRKLAKVIERLIDEGVTVDASEVEKQADKIYFNKSYKGNTGLPKSGTSSLASINKRF